MTDRMAALERVAEAARAWLEKHDRGAHANPADMRDALDALPAEPVGETVTMALFRGRLSGRLCGTMEPENEDPRDWEHIGNITFQMPPAIIIPTVAARVTP